MSAAQSGVDKRRFLSKKLQRRRAFLIITIAQNAARKASKKQDH